MRLVQRVLALALVLLVIGESSGLARAFGYGSIVACCCGPHSIARPCRCPDCPVSTHKKRTTPIGDQVVADRACDGADADEPGVLTVLALPMTAPSTPTSLRFTGLLGEPAILIRSGRALEVDRPPP